MLKRNSVEKRNIYYKIFDFKIIDFTETNEQSSVERITSNVIRHNNVAEIVGNGDTDDDDDEDDSVEELIDVQQNGEKKAIVPKKRYGFE